MITCEIDHSHSYRVWRKVHLNMRIDQRVLITRANEPVHCGNIHSACSSCYHSLSRVYVPVYVLRYSIQQHLSSTLMQIMVILIVFSLSLSLCLSLFIQRRSILRNVFSLKTTLFPLSVSR